MTDLAPIRRVQGSVRLPGSKSISNRTLLLAALANGSIRHHDLTALLWAAGIPRRDWRD